MDVPLEFISKIVGKLFTLRNSSSSLSRFGTLGLFPNIKNPQERDLDRIIKRLIKQTLILQS